MRATWYVTESGDVVDPSECRLVDGILTHERGKVAMRSPDCPMSRGVDVDAKAKAEPKPKPAKVTGDMQAETPAPPERGRPYKTRESKAS